MSQDEERTIPETPLALIIAKALRPELKALEGRLCEALVNAVSPRFLTIEADIADLKLGVADLNERMAALEQKHRARDTMPSPPGSADVDGDDS